MLLGPRKAALAEWASMRAEGEELGPGEALRWNAGAALRPRWVPSGSCAPRWTNEHRSRYEKPRSGLTGWLLPSEDAAARAGGVRGRRESPRWLRNLAWDAGLMHRATPRPYEVQGVRD